MSIIPLSFSGTFKQAVSFEQIQGLTEKEKSVRFKYVSDTCSICLCHYLPDDQLIILACMHGFHSTCFQKTVRKVCPLDNQTPDRIIKINLLGFQVLFPQPAQKIAAALFVNRHKIYHLLYSHLANLPKGIQQVFKDRRISTLSVFLYAFSSTIQAFLDVLDKDLTFQELNRISDQQIELLMELLNFKHLSNSDHQKALKSVHFQRIQAAFGDFIKEIISKESRESSSNLFMGLSLFLSKIQRITFHS